MSQNSERPVHGIRAHDPEYTSEVQQYITFLQAREDASKIDIASINLFNHAKELAQNGFSKSPLTVPSSNTTDTATFSQAANSFNDPFNDLLHSPQHNLSDPPTPARYTKPRRPPSQAVNPFLDSRYFDHYRPHCFNAHNDNSDQLLDPMTSTPMNLNPGNMSLPPTRAPTAEEALVSVNLLEGIGDVTQSPHANTMSTDIYGTEPFPRQNHF